MFKSAAVLFLYAESPVHAGSGASVGAIDLPIQREKHTDYPIIQSSGVKGAIRHYATDLHEGNWLSADDKRNWSGKINAVFGPPTDATEKHGSAVAFTDARVLLFPVRSLAGVFGWVTCPAVVARFRREMGLLERDRVRITKGGLEELVHMGPVPTQAPHTISSGSAYLCETGCGLRVGDEKSGRIVLEDLDFTTEPSKRVSELARWLARNAIPCAAHYGTWKRKLRDHLVVVDDDSFRDFVRFSTQINTRIKLDDETRTVKEGFGPWDEEALPAETVLYSMTLVQDPRKEADEAVRDATRVLDFLQKKVFQAKTVIQFGGNETIGQGLIRTNFKPVDELFPTAGSGDEQGADESKES